MKEPKQPPSAAFERECALWFDFIEKRLDEGSDKFQRLEALLWGVYPVVITCLLATRYL